MRAHGQLPHRAPGITRLWKTGPFRSGPASRVCVLAAVALVCVACANPSLDSEADELRTDITDLPNVASAQLDYNDPVPLSSGSLILEVTMDSDATPDQVVAVAETAYRAFSSTHDGEESELSIDAGATTIALRSFESEASVTAVGTAVRTGLMAAPELGSVAIDITTDDVSAGDHVAGTYLVSLPVGSTSADVPDLLATLAAHQTDNSLIGWGAVASDGASLSYDRGFPPEQLVGRWERLQTFGLPLAVRATENGALFVEGRLRSRIDVNATADRRALDKITHPQLRALGDDEWAYTLVGPGGAYLADIDRFVCVSTSDGPYDDELEAWVTEEFGPCEVE